MFASKIKLNNKDFEWWVHACNFTSYSRPKWSSDLPQKNLFQQLTSKVEYTEKADASIAQTCSLQFIGFYHHTPHSLLKTRYIELHSTFNMHKTILRLNVPTFENALDQVTISIQKSSFHVLLTEFIFCTTNYTSSLERS